MARPKNTKMDLQRLGDTVFQVGSRSSDRKYLVSFGTEGAWWACTCQGFALSRNKAGGLGLKAKGTCAHCKEVEENSDLIAKAESEAQLNTLRELMEASMASLRSIK